MKFKIRKWIKWIFGTIVGLCLLISVLLYVFKDEIIGLVVTEVNKSLNAKVQVSRIDLTFWGSFPNLSVDFNNVFIPDAFADKKGNDTLLYSDLIRLKFNPIDIWNENYAVKKVEIHPGTIQLRVNKDGDVNYNILKESQSKSNSKFELKLKKVTFEKIRFAYDNQITGQLYETKVSDLKLEGKFTEKRFTLFVSSDLFIRRIKSESITLLADKSASVDIGIEVDQEKNTFKIPKATVFISKLPFVLSGAIDPKQLQFNLSAKKLRLEEVATKLSSHLDQIEQFEGQGLCNFNLNVAGKNEKNSTPMIRCDFDVSAGALREPTQQLKISGINLKGSYSNEGGKENEFLKLWDMRFKTATGPFQGEFLLTNFLRPHYEGKAKGNLDLASIHGIFRLPYIEQIVGFLDVNGQFDIQTVVDEAGQRALDLQKCVASLTMRNIDASVIDDSRTFKSLNGFVGIDGDEAALQDIRVKIGSSDFQVNGIFQDIAPYIYRTGKLVASIELESNFMDVKDLSSTHVDKTSTVNPERNFMFPDDIDGEVLLHVKQLKYDAHRFLDLQSNLDVGARKLTFNQLSLENAQTEIGGTLTVEETRPEWLVLNTNLSASDLSFRNLFREWNNFDQEVIKEDNISGKAAVEMVFQAPFDLRTGIQKKEIFSKVHVKIEDGALKNVSTFKSITESLKTSSARLILKKHNINNFEKKLLDLRFETLENTFVIQNGRLEIPLMQIKSNALNVETFGWHTFDNQIDYHFAFEFRDLFEKPVETEFGIEEDDGSGVKIFMRMHGTIDNPIIEWDELAKKEQAKANREAAKQEAFSILKSEFGFRKNDTTVGVYHPIKKPTEELRIQFGEENETPEVEQKKESEIKRKMQEKIKKLKESTKEEESTFEFE